MKFKPGDRVRITERAAPDYRGRYGTVDHVDGSKVYFCFDGSTSVMNGPDYCFDLVDGYVPMTTPLKGTVTFNIT